MKLNIGCGKSIMEGFVNVDCVESNGVDIVHDLDTFPYPFDDNSVDYVHAQDILEHVKDAKKVIEELWRICKMNAEIYVRVPHFTSPVAWTDLTHVRPFGRNSFGYYKQDKSKSQSLNSTDVSCPVIFDVEYKFLFNRPFSYIGLKCLFNKFPKLYENIFPWLVPCGLMEFRLKVVKDA